MADVKQTLISLAVVMLAAGILAGMVIYTVSVMRDIETRILTGMICVTQEAGTGLRNGATGSGQHVFTPSQLLASGS